MSVDYLQDQVTSLKDYRCNDIPSKTYNIYFSELYTTLLGYSKNQKFPMTFFLQEYLNNSRCINLVLPQFTAVIRIELPPPNPAHKMTFLNPRKRYFPHIASLLKG